MKLRIGFVSQAKTSTPTFVFFVNEVKEKKLLCFSSHRFFFNSPIWFIFLLSGFWKTRFAKCIRSAAPLCPFCGRRKRATRS